MEKSRRRKKRYTISVGLNDKDENVQMFQTNELLQLVAHCCKGYGLPFSSYLQDGGYVFCNGKYISEKSVCIVIVDADEKLIDEIGKDLCAFLNQESVMVIVDEIDCYYISESL